jgi:hypothetical protein
MKGRTAERASSKRSAESPRSAPIVPMRATCHRGSDDARACSAAVSRPLSTHRRAFPPCARAQRRGPNRAAIPAQRRTFALTLPMSDGGSYDRCK